MSVSRLRPRFLGSLAGLALATLLASCTDAPVVEPGSRGTLVLPNAFALKGAVAGTPRADALNAAFAQVNRFRLVIRRAGRVALPAALIVLRT